MNGQDENVNLSRYLYFLLFLNNNLERWWCLMYEFQIQQRKREEVGEKKNEAYRTFFVTKARRIKVQTLSSFQKDAMEVPRLLQTASWD